MDVECGSDSSIASWRSVGSARTRTVLLSMRENTVSCSISHWNCFELVEQAAIASARTMGMGDADGADQAAVESMRATLDTVAH